MRFLLKKNQVLKKFLSYDIIIYMGKWQQDVYDNVLLSVVFHLDKYPKKSGQEGTAYFIGEDFVVKEMLGTQDSLFKYENFETYCRELQDFHKKGYAVPEVYSWTMLPNNLFKDSMFDRYYVLQERIKGPDMFAKGLSGSFDNCSSFCTMQEFNAAVLSREGHLFKKIVEVYLKNSLELIEKLDAMPESLVENFVVSDYQMMKNHTFGAVDVHSGNVIFNGERMIIIDNGFMENFFAGYSDDKLRQITMKDVLRILSGNLNVLSCSAHYKRKWTEFQPLYLKHKKACKSVMRKFINVTNRTLKPVFYEDMEFFNSRDFIRNVVQGEDEQEMLGMLHKNF